MKTFRTFSFGCRVNQAEEEEIQKKMLQSGFSWAEKEPDIMIVNTCAVTEKAEREARQFVYNIKRESPNTFLVTTGCALTNWQSRSAGLKASLAGQKDALLGRLPIDFSVDNVNKEYLVELISHKFNVKRLTFNIKKNLHQDKYISSGRYLLKIQDGCHRFCTFCIVPYLRGLPTSSRISSIVEKINHLPKHMKEVVLTAINTEAFGKETGETFIDLVKTVLEKTKIERLSFGSIHPWSINQDFLKFYRDVAGENRLIDFFHIPLQSGSDKMLQLMKRNYKRKEIEEKLFEIQKINPYALIGTDVIVGFLEETDKDFEDTYEFLKKVPISKFHVFRFSKKKKTAAYYMAKRLPEPTPTQKQARSKRLIQLSQRKYAQFQASLIGKTFSCLLLPQYNHGQEGLLSNQVPIFVHEKEKNNSFKLHSVLVESVKKTRLIGKLLD